MTADLDDMKAMRPTKRYALAVIFISMKAASSIDDLVQVFITWIRNIEGQAKINLEEYRIKHAGKTDEHILLLYKMLTNFKKENIAEEKISAIEEQLGGNVNMILEQCAEV